MHVSLCTWQAVLRLQTRQPTTSAGEALHLQCTLCHSQPGLDAQQGSLYLKACQAPQGCAPLAACLVSRTCQLTAPVGHLR